LWRLNNDEPEINEIAIMAGFGAVMVLLAVWSFGSQE